MCKSYSHTDFPFIVYLKHHFVLVIKRIRNYHEIKDLDAPIAVEIWTCFPESVRYYP